MSDKKNFGYLGNTFQIQLLNNIVTYKDFANSIIEVIEPHYFDNQYFKIICQMIKEYYLKYEHTPTFDTLEQLTKSEISSPMAQRSVLDTIDQVRNVSDEGSIFVQEKSLKFCKQQELQKVMTKAQSIIDKGDFESYDKLEEMVRGALQVGEVDKGTTDVFFNLDEVLDDDFRHPIPLGIPGIDNLLKGGLAKGEIGVILAPTGVGKSTCTTKIANHAFNLGYNVLQIFFEDNPKIIQRKHFTLWTGIHPDDLSENKEEVMERVKYIQNSRKNKLILKKLPSDTVTMNQIKNQVRKMIAEGTKVDMIILDYIDCVVPDKMLGDEWKSEGSVMRAFEALCHELDIAGWTATQGNRCVSLDTVVNIENKGLIKIKDVELGDKILTHEGYKNISYIFPIEKQPVYKIKTKSGKDIKVSAKHKFPTLDGLKSINSGLEVGNSLYVKNNTTTYDYLEDLVSSIELIGEEETIDITVDDTHMFYANDIYTHNSSISADVVTTDQMGGSIKKAQVGHVIITIAKTLQQKEMNLATIAITKSRIGKDGIVFENCKFDNGMLEIDTEQSVTFLGHEEQKEEKNRNRIKELLEKKKLKEQQES
jgi:replicative DNA helicase